MPVTALIFFGADVGDMARQLWQYNVKCIKVDSSMA